MEAQLKSLLEKLSPMAMLQPNGERAAAIALAIVVAVARLLRRSAHWRAVLLGRERGQRLDGREAAYALEEAFKRHVGLPVAAVCAVRVLYPPV